MSLLKGYKIRFQVLGDNGLAYEFELGYLARDLTSLLREPLLVGLKSKVLSIGVERIPVYDLENKKLVLEK